MTECPNCPSKNTHLPTHLWMLLIGVASNSQVVSLVQNLLPVSCLSGDNYLEVPDAAIAFSLLTNFNRQVPQFLHRLCKITGYRIPCVSLNSYFPVIDRGVSRSLERACKNPVFIIGTFRKFASHLSFSYRHSNVAYAHLKFSVSWQDSLENNSVRYLVATAATTANPLKARCL